MSRIKKRGLDYFPMNTDFIHDRLVRRILKREGDAALAVLLQTLCSIYSGEGYYVLADRLFYDDLADSLYQQEASDVERIIRLAVEYGLFDAALFEKHHVLTSVDIQRQFLFITKRRNSSTIDACYNLLPAEEPVTELPSAALSGQEKNAAKDVDENDVPEGINAAGNGNAVTFQSENSENAPQSTQSIAQQSIAQQTKGNFLLDSSPGTGGTEGADGASAEEVYLRKIESMRPPKDGLKRNLDGLLLNLRQLRIPVQQQYAIVLKSNFGVIGHPMWKGFGVLRDSHGKIRQPGNYLLSLCR
ncbi:DUF4373 domain-containing protein [Bacteroides sp.]|uniref:DUF4373 domain-containing protein n=1 Tax=Bacteroides sp. TaxID=29523 RepID=UPI003AB4AF4B